MRKNASSTSSTGRQSVASVEKVLKLLLMFHPGQPVRVTDVSKRLSVSASTAYRLLSTLEESKFVRQDGTTRAYLIGESLLSLGRSLLRETSFEDMVLPELTTLAKRLGESAAFGILQGNHVGFITHADGPQRDCIGSRIGAMFPAHASATGRALLAEVPMPLLRRFYATRGFAGGRKHAVHSWGTLIERLDHVREDGYESSFEECEVGVNELAVAVKDRAGYVYGTVTIAGPSSRFRKFKMPAYAAEVDASALRLASALYDSYAPAMIPRVRWLLASRFVDYLVARNDPLLSPFLSADR
jgi:DNA-binding IclR family transcriptional regulator